MVETKDIDNAGEVAQNESEEVKQGDQDQIADPSDGAGDTVVKPDQESSKLENEIEVKDGETNLPDGEPGVPQTEAGNDERSPSKAEVVEGGDVTTTEEKTPDEADNSPSVGHGIETCRIGFV